MTHHPLDVSRGLLVYPPTDLKDFLTRLQAVGGAGFPPLSDAANTPYDPSSAQEIVETYLQLPKGGAQTVDLNAPPLFVTEKLLRAKNRRGCIGISTGVHSARHARQLAYLFSIAGVMRSVWRSGECRLVGAYGPAGTVRLRRP